MPYDDDPAVLDWFVRALADRRPVVRRQAIELLESVDCDQRAGWLSLAERDSDPRVAAAAARVGAVVKDRPSTEPIALMLSDFMEGAGAADLEWEWEYSVKVCQGVTVPRVPVLVWTKQEDDRLAKRLALMKTFPMRPPDPTAVPVIVGKRAVTRYTRSPRSFSEAARWHKEGRPTYEDP
jgi:hypothetical protein